MHEQGLLAAKSKDRNQPSDPVVVYDRVTRAWQLILGNDLHFGYFETPETSLAEATTELTHRMLDWATPVSGTRVLDVGCGIGGPALLLAEQTACHVTGISTSTVGIELAARHAESQGLRHRTEFLERDGTANGLPDQSFDCVWIMESSHLMERKDRLLAESARALRKTGLLVLCDIMVKETIPFQYLVRNLEEFENLNAVFGKQYVEQLRSYAQLVEESGLTVLRTEDVSAAVLPTLEHWRRNATVHADEVRELVGEEYLERFTKACRFLQRLWTEEKLGYGMLLAHKDG